MLPYLIGGLPVARYYRWADGAYSLEREHQSILAILRDLGAKRIFASEGLGELFELPLAPEGSNAAGPG
jgi:hypothetical protein